MWISAVINCINIFDFFTETFFLQISDFRNSLNTINSACEEVFIHLGSLFHPVAFGIFFLISSHSSYGALLGTKFYQVERNNEEDFISWEYFEPGNGKR